MATDFKDFLLWEATARDTIDFKKIYVDMAAGDTLAGLVLSEIVYWYLPNRNGQSKLRVNHDGQEWIACRRYEWWDRTRLTPRQSDRVLGILESQKLIIIALYKFDGEVTKHVRLDFSVFMSSWAHCVANPPSNPFAPILPNGKIEFTETKNPIHQNGKNELTDSGNPVTEIPTKTTTKTTKKDSLPAKAGVKKPSTKKSKSSNEDDKKPSITQPLNDAVAIHIQHSKPEFATKKTGLYAQAIAAVARKRLGRDKLTAEEYQGLAKAVPIFWPWVEQEAHLSVNIFAPTTIEDLYAQWLDAGKPDVRKQASGSTKANGNDEAIALMDSKIAALKQAEENTETSWEKYQPKSRRPEVDPNNYNSTWWRACLGQLQIELNRSTYDTWLKGIRLVEIRQENPRILVVEVSNSYKRDWITQHLKLAMEEKLTRLYRDTNPVQLEFVIEEEFIKEEIYD